MAPLQLILKTHTIKRFLEIFTAVTAVCTPACAAQSGFHYGMSYFVLPNGIWPQVTTLYSTGQYKQAVFLSFDGMHQFDLSRIIAENPGSNFTKLVNNGIMYSSARATSPSDSLPATASIFTGAAPRTHGLWTAFADKHLSYEFLNGPSGTGLSEGYFPEIASVGDTLAAQQAWDDLHCKYFNNI